MQMRYAVTFVAITFSGSADDGGGGGGGGGRATVSPVTVQHDHILEIKSRSRKAAER